MAEAGILDEDDRVELIEGEIVEMSPVGSRHGACVDFLNRLCVRLDESVIVRVQGSIRLDEHNEPEPDISVLKSRDDFYVDELPGPDDVLAVMEVSERTSPYDRGVKLPLYARSGIPEAWIVDMSRGSFERHTEPSGDAYRVTVRAARGEELESTTVRDLTLKGDDVLR